MQLAFQGSADAGIEGRIASLEGRLASLEGRIDSLNGRIDSLEPHTANVRATPPTLRGLDPQSPLGGDLAAQGFRRVRQPIELRAARI